MVIGLHSIEVYILLYHYLKNKISNTKIKYFLMNKRLQFVADLVKALLKKKRSSGYKDLDEENFSL